MAEALQKLKLILEEAKQENEKLRQHQQDSLEAERLAKEIVELKSENAKLKGLIATQQSGRNDNSSSQYGGYWEDDGLEPIWIPSRKEAFDWNQNV